MTFHSILGPYLQTITTSRIGVGVILKEDSIGRVLEVNRVSDRMMYMKLDIGVMMTVISAYAPYVGCLKSMTSSG